MFEFCKQLAKAAAKAIATWAANDPEVRRILKKTAKQLGTWCARAVRRWLGIDDPLPT